MRIMTIYKGKFISEWLLVPEISHFLKFKLIKIKKTSFPFYNKKEAIYMLYFFFSLFVLLVFILCGIALNNV